MNGTMGIDEAQSSSRRALSDMKRMRAVLTSADGVAAILARRDSYIGFRDAAVATFFFTFGTIGSLYLSNLHFAFGFLFLPLQLFGLMGFAALQHEAWHRYALPIRKLNNWFGRWCIAPLFLNDFDQSAALHLMHHAKYGSASDPDVPAIRRTPRDFLAAHIKRLAIVPVVAEGIVRLRQGRPDRPEAGGAMRAARRMSGAAIARAAAVHALWASGALALGHWTSILLAYAAPLFATSFLAGLREIREHDFLPDGRMRMFNFECPWYERVFIAGGFFNLHAFHHVLPELPQRALPRVQQELEEHRDKYREFYAASDNIALPRRSYFSRGAPTADNALTKVAAG